MSEYITLEQIDEAVKTIEARTQYRPKLAMILGSGLNDLANAIENADIIPAEEIPNWPKSTVQGHMGRLVIGKLAGKQVMVMQGRSHYYEGYSMAQVTFPVRVMNRMGVNTLFVTNAAGAVNQDYAPGDVMLIVDHINLIGMGGLSPLRGPNLDVFGERFPDMSQPYDRDLCDLARGAAKKSGIRLHEGVYTILAGPSFESPAELRYLKGIGTDAVGMSTVPEVIVARHGKMRVLGISGISNKANLDGSTVTTHEEVLEAGHTIAPKIKDIFLGVLENL